jgi:hypothetical protein
LQFGGSTFVTARAVFNGNTSTTITTGNNYANVIIGSAPLTTPATGTIGIVANQSINTIGTITNGGVTPGLATNLYVDAAPTGATANYSAYVNGPLAALNVINPSNAITATANAATVPITSRISTVTNNSAAALTITLTTTGAVDGQMVMVRILDFSAVAETLTFVNTENSTITVPTTSNGSTTLPLTVGFQYNNATSKWRCIAVA